MNKHNRWRRWMVWVMPALVVYAVILWCHNPLYTRAEGRPDPDRLLAEALRRCEDVQDYRCIFIAQERVGDNLKPQQRMEVLVRERPFSIYLHWLENMGRVRRACYIAGQIVSSDGREQVLVEPAGAIARALAGTVKVDLRGAEAQNASRYTLDQFGFRNTLRRIMAENERYKSEGMLTWEPVGEGFVDGRPTILLQRRLPYDGSDGEFPNALLTIHLDRAWRVPVAIQAFADPYGRVLLENYVCTAVELNPGLSDEDFQL